MTIKKLQFKPLEQYQKQNKEYSIKVAEQQAKLDEAKDAYQKATQAYEKAFTESIRTGKDATTELAKLDTEADDAKAAYEKAARDTSLALSAISKPDFDTVALVEQFRTGFTPQVKASVIPDVEERLKTARDMLISAMQDMRQADEDYQEVTEEVAKISRGNKERGLTRDYLYVSHPTTDATLLNQRGITNAVQKVFEDYNAALRGSLPYDFKYIKSAEVAK